MSAPSPTATGTFARTPLSNLLIYALDRGLDGTLVVEEGAARSAVRFCRGAPVKVKLPDGVHLLGALLVEAGHTSAEARDHAVRKAESEGQLTGFVLVSAGEVSAEDVQDALSTQVLRRLEALAAYSDNAVYGYYEGHDFLAAIGSPRGAEALDPLAAIWHVVRRRPPAARVQATIERLGDRPLKLHRAARPARFGFTDAERAIVDVLRVRPYDFKGLVETRILPEESIGKLVYALVATRHLDVGGGGPVGVEGAIAADAGDRPRTVPRRGTAPRATRPRPARQGTEPKAPSPPAPPVSDGTDTPPGEVSADHAALKEEIIRRGEQINAQNYYEILGVDPKADEGSIRAAFFQLAKVWHPDRIPKSLGDQREAAAKIFARMTEAHQVLSADEQRKEYDQLMKEGGGTAEEQEQVQRILRAVTAFQKAEVHLRKGNLAEAEREAKFALDNDAEQPEYGALYADILSRQPGRTNFDEPLRLVNEAKKRQDKNLRIRMHRARVLQRAGQARSAFLEFQRVAEEDPRNVEAAREARLYRMRQGQKPPEAKTGSKRSDDGVLNQDIGQLFGKFFKR